MADAAVDKLFPADLAAILRLIVFLGFRY